MRRGRTTLAGAGAALAVAAIAAPVALAAESATATQTDSPDPVDQGGTVTVTTTITNTGDPQADMQAHVSMARPGTQTAVDNTYLSFVPRREAARSRARASTARSDPSPTATSSP